jgi:hypothetical protein
VHAISVCTAKAKDDSRIHGLEVWGSTIDADGNLKPASNSVKFQFTDCAKWHEKESCPAGAVATGVRGFYDPARGLQGVSLRCHQLEPRGPKPKSG